MIYDTQGSRNFPGVYSRINAAIKAPNLRTKEIYPLVLGVRKLGILPIMHFRLLDILIVLSGLALFHEAKCRMDAHRADFQVSRESVAEHVLGVTI